MFGIRRQFIARPDSAKGQIVYKWPDLTIPRFAQLTVEPDEVALFVREGKAVGIFPAGTAQLDGKNIPFLDGLIDSATGGNALRAELYFISTREFVNLPFGGVIDNVVDPDTSLAIGLRVFGDYSLKVADPSALVLNLVGTRDVRDNSGITDWMRDMLLKTIRTDVVNNIVSNHWQILGIAAHTDEIEQETIAKVQGQIATYGITIVRMGNFTISIGEEDEATLKNLRRDASYTKLAGGFKEYGAGEALLGLGQGAAQGGGAGNAAFLGLGLGVGNLLGGIGQTPTPASAAAATPTPAAAPTTATCTCGATRVPGAKFCVECGAPVATTQTCPGCGATAPAGAKFCAECGAKFAP